MSIAILGIDLGKNSCSIVGVDAAGAVIVRRTMRRQSLIDYVAKLPACVVAMEACCGAHHLGRLFAAQGHEIRLMSPEYVRPYIKAQKNDDRDAEGIAEATSRPTMRFIELKCQEQLDVQTLHRVRARLVAERTNLINQLRTILLERGVTFLAGHLGRKPREVPGDAGFATETNLAAMAKRKLTKMPLMKEMAETLRRAGRRSRYRLRNRWSSRSSNRSSRPEASDNSFYGAIRFEPNGQ